MNTTGTPEQDDSLLPPQRPEAGSPAADSPEADPLGVPAADAALAASDHHCTNCGALLHGSFCHRCGQPTRHFIRFFPVVVREVTEDTLGVDGRFWRTVVALLFRPGRLTLDYLHGRRVFYSPPIRLYLLTSLVAFLVFTTVVDTALDSNGVLFNGGDEQARAEVLEELRQEGIVVGDEGSVQAGEPSGTTATDNATASGVSAAADLAAPETPAAPALDPADDVMADAEGTGNEDASGEDGFVIFGSDPWDAETNPLTLPFLTQGMNRRLNREIGEFEARIPEIKKNPRILVDQILEVLPQTMFVLLPVFALILKFYYLFSRRYYMEHLLFALHNHAFVFAIMTLMVLVDWLGEWLGGSAQDSWWSSTLNGVGQTWLFIYLFLAQKRVYRQGWWMTSIKYLMVGFSYLILSLFALVGAALVGVLLV